MEYTIKAIPTVYKGRLYRSRLEARWASMFDLLGWNVEYEPCDFNGWIPDFAIIGAKQSVYVEVKPVSELPIDLCIELGESECTSEILILGLSIGPAEDGPTGTQRLGWLRESDDWSEAVFGIWKGEYRKGNPNDTIGFCHSIQDFTDRITGLYDGGSFGSGPDPSGLVQQYWRQAGNAAQWKPPTQGGR